MQINKKNNRGQGAIDMTLVVVVMCVILFAALKMFVWFNQYQCLVGKEQVYHGGHIYTYAPPPIHLIQGEGQ